MSYLALMNMRSQTADLLKGIAVLLMMQVHILELFASNAISGSFYGKILLFLGGPPVAPVFMLILGYYIAASKRPVKQLLIRGIKIFLLGMLLNLALNLNLIVSVSKGLFRIDLLPYIFGIDILQFAGISILLLALVKKILAKNIIITLVCIGAAAFLGHFLPAWIPGNRLSPYFSALFYGSSDWSYFPLFPWICYPLSGIAFYQLKQKVSLDFLNSVSIRITVFILFVAFLLLTFHYALSVSSDLPAYYHHGLCFASWTILFLAFYGSLIAELDRHFGESTLSGYLKWLGQHVTIIYVIQWVIIGNVATEIYKTVSSPWYLLLWFLIVLLLSGGITYLILRLKKDS
ncbi:MAG: heparan-alpha-glucosaminide N-acetyltransferase domain-containing protein [Bacteroidia bacterium]